MSALRQTQAALRAIAEPRRMTILKLVRSRELRAGEIASHFRTTRSAISQHLRVLTKAGLLHERRQGTSRLYRLRPQGFTQLQALLNSFWDASLSRLKDEAEAETRNQRAR
jgi:DNA-binding transcriptional ArsR family regulator